MKLTIKQKQLVKEYAKKLVGKRLNESPYKPYKGPSGPSDDVIEANTKHLAKALKKLGIPFKEDRNYALELYGKDDLNLILIHPENQKELYVGYDRWGYVIDGEGMDEMDHLDQASLKETIKFLKNLFGK